MPSVDRRYFESLMQGKELSLRQLAARMNLSHSQLSLAFSGERKIQLNEAVQLASIFGEPLHRIVEAAGVAVGHIGPSRVSVVGAMNGDGTVSLYGNDIIERTPAPEGLPADCVAVQARTGGSPLDWLDAAVFFMPPLRGVDSAVLGRFALCQIENGPAVLAGVRRGYVPGTHNLRGPYNADSVKLESASVVVMTRN